MSILLLLLPGACSSIFASSMPAEPVEFFVSPEGSDVFAGTREKPFATLERARDAIRNLKRTAGLPAGGVTVLLRGGAYALTRSFELTEQDSGSRQAPVVYRRYGQEEVRLMGGKRVANFRPVNDVGTLNRIDLAARGKVLSVDLGKEGITDFGEIEPRGYGRPEHPAALELFFQDKPMTLARWPNRDWAIIAAAPAGKDGGRFAYEGDRPRRWLKAADVWLHGYWTQDWADSFVRVKSIDTKAREITTAEPHGIYGYTPGKRYYALNLLEELDEPGEWYLNRKTGILYFWPPAPIEQGKVFVSVLPAIVSMRNVSHVSLHGLTMELCRGTAVEMDGGEHNRIAGCIVRNTGNDAISISNGTDNGVVSCDINGTGEGGIRLGGGERKTLTPGGNFAENNHIHHYSRWCRTYRPAVWLSGVGNRVSHNLIHDAPHTGILLVGNEHLIEFNEVFRVALETDDVGAVYTFFQDWTNRGNVIRYNFFHDLIGSLKDRVRAVYLDDAASGTVVYGNVFHRTSFGVMIGGGRDNQVENNIFVECDPAVWVDGRGLAGIGGNLAPNADFAPGGRMQLHEKLKEVNHDQPPYSERYPGLATILDEEPLSPAGNAIVRNIFAGGTSIKLDEVAGRVVAVDDNFAEGDIRFVDRAELNFQITDDSPAYRLGFKRIPIEGIGLYRDEHRPILPVVMRK